MNALIRLLDMGFLLMLGLFVLSVYRLILIRKTRETPAPSSVPSQPAPCLTLSLTEGCITREKTVRIDRIRIGRDRSSDIVLSNERASRSHAEIWVQDGHIWIVDLGSTNGTELNGEVFRADKRRLRQGDTIRIGGENGDASVLMLN